jgi:hypothetical protein
MFIRELYRSRRCFASFMRRDFPASHDWGKHDQEENWTAAVGGSAGRRPLRWGGSGASAGAREAEHPGHLGDDIGYFNVSAYNRGMMGYRTPSIDRIAREGAIFTDWYGQQSCTAGRAAFITGQSPIRTGLLKVGLPGAPGGHVRRKTRRSRTLLKARAT